MAEGQPPVPVPAEQVARLRRRTGMPWMECKRFLASLTPTERDQYIAAAEIRPRPDLSVYTLKRNDPEGALKLRAKRIVEGTWRVEDEEIILMLQDDDSEILKGINQWDREHRVVAENGLVKLKW
jgi:hypothetical protein